MNYYLIVSDIVDDRFISDPMELMFIKEKLERKLGHTNYYIHIHGDENIKLKEDDEVIEWDYIFDIRSKKTR